MTFIPSTNNTVSIENSTSTLLLANQIFTGTAIDVSKYSSITITISSDVDSDNLGVKISQSTDNVIWESQSFSYLKEKKIMSKTFKVISKYFRIEYTNGTINQTSFRLQTRFELTETKTEKLPIDGFGRVRVSNPHTLLSGNHVGGKNTPNMYENITGSATSVHNANTSSVLLSTTGVGNIVRCSRSRAIYQPGKSLLIYMTGVLNANNNAATVSTKIGYFDNEDGYYFQYNNNVLSIVERSSVSGSVVETIVNQSSWNVNDGNILDPTKALIFWFNLEWLGVGLCDCGVVIDKEFITLHRFRHSNLFSNVYIKTACLTPRYEINSTGGSGALSCICYTVISEGGYFPIGNVFSANTGTSTQTISGTREPLIILRLKSGKKNHVILNKISVVATSNANSLVEIFKFSDITAASILDNSVFISAGVESAVEYNIAANTIDTTNGILLESNYFSNNSDASDFQNPENGSMNNNPNNVSDLIAVCISSLGGNEDYAGSCTWGELL